MEYSKVKLGDICKTNQLSYSQKDNWEIINYLDTGNITQNVIDEIQELKVGVDKIPSRAKRKVQINDIIYSTVRPNQLHYGIIKALPENLLVSTGFTVISVDNKKADADYVYYYLTQSHITESLQAIGEQSTSAYPSIKPSDLENIDIDLPSLEIQKKVSYILRTIEEKMVLNSKLNANLEELVTNIFNNSFDLENVEYCPISDMIEVRDGTHASPKPIDEGYPLVTSKHLLKYGVNKADANKICKQDYDKVNERSKVDNGDILISMIGTVGLISYVMDDIVDYAIKNVGLFKTSNTKKLQYFTLSYLKSSKITNHINMCLAGSTQKYISLTELRKIPFPLFWETDLNRFNSIVEPLYLQIKSLNNENGNLVILRDLLLSKLMAGEIDLSEMGLDI